MKKTIKKRNKTASQKPGVKLIEILFGIIIFLYIIVPTFTPNLMALDTNTPKFAATALLNLVVFGVLVANGYLNSVSMRSHPAQKTGVDL